MKYTMAVSLSALLACNVARQETPGPKPSSVVNEAAAADSGVQGAQDAPSHDIWGEPDRGSVIRTDAGATDSGEVQCDPYHMSTYIGSCITMQDVSCTDYYGGQERMNECLSHSGARYSTSHCVTDNAFGVCFVDYRQDILLHPPKRCEETVSVSYPLTGQPGQAGVDASKSLCEASGGVWSEP